MSMVTNTLSLPAACGRGAEQIFLLLVLVDYIEMVVGAGFGIGNRCRGNVSLRVPQLLEEVVPFCILIGAMTSYLALSRRLELVVPRAPHGLGVAVHRAHWPARMPLLGVLATTAYNPMSANFRKTKKIETVLWLRRLGGGIQDASGFWINQSNGGH